MTRSHLLIAAALALVTGCQTPPPPMAPTLPAAYSVAAPVDAVWANLTDVLFSQGFDLENTAREGGVITTEWRELDDATANAWMLCGFSMFNRRFRAQGELDGWARLQVVLRERGPEQSALRLRADFSLLTWDEHPEDAGYQVSECVTTGELEASVVEAVGAQPDEGH